MLQFMRNIYVLKAHYRVTNIKPNNRIYFTNLDKTSFTPIVINGGKGILFHTNEMELFSLHLSIFLSSFLRTVPIETGRFMEITDINGIKCRVFLPYLLFFPTNWCALYFEYARSIIFAMCPCFRSYSYHKMLDVKWETDL